MSNSLKIRNIVALSVSGLLLVSPMVVAAQAPQNTVNPNTNRTQQAPAARDRYANQNSQRPLFMGTVTAKDARSLIIRSNSSTYRVLISAGTRLLNANRRPISLSRIRVNDRVRVQGTQTGPGTVAASLVRDISR